MRQSLLRDHPIEEAAYHAQQVIDAAWFRARPGREKDVDHGGGQCPKVGDRTLYQESVKKVQGPRLCSEFSPESALVIDIGLDLLAKQTVKRLGVHGNSSP
jgi:hypothetical protein